MDIIKELSSIFGSKAAFSRAIGVSNQVVSNWNRRKNIPINYWKAIESATDGRIRPMDIFEALVNEN